MRLLPLDCPLAAIRMAWSHLGGSRMTTNILARWTIAVGLSVLAAAPLAAQNEIASPPDPWIHAATGTPFPAQVNTAQRGRVFEYTDDGHNASVGYAIEKDGYRATVTLYVYPAIPGTTCDEEFAEVRSHIERYEGAQVMREGKVPAPSGRGGPAALHAGYAIPAGSMHEDLPALRSDVYLYCSLDGEWLVKYRATWAAEADFGTETETLLQRISWPENIGG